MFFNHERVRGFLVRHRHVYTLRDHMIREGRHRLVHGSYFTNKLLGYGMVRLVKKLGRLRPGLLRPYVARSGMSSSREWIDALPSFTKKKLPRSIYLYRVDICRRIAAGNKRAAG